ncbi:MAG TPA: hypothetical protein VG944_04595, partial [Fimbriimonas sp.]|nr:hypothetical protein [Fimbriimonas sp.]
PKDPENSLHHRQQKHPLRSVTMDLDKYLMKKPSQVLTQTLRISGAIGDADTSADFRSAEGSAFQFHPGAIDERASGAIEDADTSADSQASAIGSVGMRSLGSSSDWRNDGLSSAGGLLRISYSSPLHFCGCEVAG